MHSANNVEFDMFEVAVLGFHIVLRAFAVSFQQLVISVFQKHISITAMMFLFQHDFHVPYFTSHVMYFKVKEWEN